MARARLCRLLAHCILAARSRTFCTAGKSKPIKIAMMAMTTSNSISVKAARRAGDRRVYMAAPKNKEYEHRVRFVARSGSQRVVRAGRYEPGDSILKRDRILSFSDILTQRRLENNEMRKKIAH